VVVAGSRDLEASRRIEPVGRGCGEDVDDLEPGRSPQGRGAPVMLPRHLESLI